MRFNRSVPPCAVIPVLIYPDPSAAAGWLSKAFGFTVRLRIANHRIQMKAGDGCFTIAEGNTTPNNSHIIQVRIEDARGHCERARQSGAIILTEPQDQPMASANTTFRTSAATAGTSPKPLPTLLQKNGAAALFTLSDVSNAAEMPKDHHERKPAIRIANRRPARTTLRATPGPGRHGVGVLHGPGCRGFA